MISMQAFLSGMLISATLTGLVTEAVKKILDEHHKQYHSNTLAGLVATIVSAALGGGYIFATSTALTNEVIVSWVGLVFTTWLCAMVGYDKVIQTIGQFSNNKKDDE